MPMTQIATTSTAGTSSHQRNGRPSITVAPRGPGSGAGIARYFRVSRLRGSVR